MAASSRILAFSNLDFGATSREGAGIPTGDCGVAGVCHGRTFLPLLLLSVPQAGAAFLLLS